MHVFNLKANFAPLWHSNFTLLATQNHQIFKKNHLRGPCENDSIFVSIFFLFRRPLGAHLAPNMAPLGAARATQEAPLAPQDRPWSHPGSRLEPEGGQEPPRPPRDIDFRPFWRRFCIIFVGFYGPKVVPRTFQMTIRKLFPHANYCQHVATCFVSSTQVHVDI